MQEDRRAVASSRAISRRAIVRSGLAVGASLVVASCVSRTRGPTTDGLGNIALSPDGRTVAVAYREPGSKSQRLLLYKWQSGELIRIPHAGLDYPSFAPDGTSLAARRGHDEIVLLDLRSFEIRSIISHTHDFEDFDPRFSPSGRSLIYAKSLIGAPAGIVLVDLDSGSTRELLAPSLGFTDVSDLCFIGDAEILFQGRAPRDAALVQSAAGLGRGPVDRLQYRLRLAEANTPNLSWPTLLVPQLEIRQGTVFGDAASGLSASWDGAVLAWTSLSLTDPNLTGLFNFEVFERREGRVTQLTQRRTYTRACAISSDGKTIAFTEDPGRGTNFDLTILDRRTSATIATNLLSHLDLR